MSELVRSSLGIVGDAVTYFGEPPLLVDASQVIFERFKTAVDVVSPVVIVGEEHKIYDHDNFFMHKADGYDTLVTERTPNEPDVYIGYLRGEPSEVRCTWRQTNTWPATERRIRQETTVLFFGGNNERIKQHYAVLDSDGGRLSYPPAGVFVDFSCFEEGEQVASLYGTVGSGGNVDHWRMDGMTKDKTILHAGDHVRKNFAISFSRSLLLPAQRTLIPQFFLEDIPQGQTRIRRQ